MQFVVILIALVMVFANQDAEAQSAETLWRARSLEAKDNIKRLLDSKKVAKKVECEFLIEQAFEGLNDPKFKAFSKTDKGGLTVLLTIGDPKTKSLLGLAFLFGDDSRRPLFIRPIFFEDASKTAWTFAITPLTSGGTFGIETKDCEFLFSSENYLSPSVKAK